MLAIPIDVQQDVGRIHRWIIRHSAADYKTGRSYGERPPLVLAHHINPELEAFVDTWRAKLDPQHDFLFTRWAPSAKVWSQSRHRRRTSKRTPSCCHYNHPSLFLLPQT